MNRRFSVFAVGMVVAGLAGCPSSNDDDSANIGMNQGSRMQNGVQTDPGDGNTVTTGGSIDSAVVEERLIDLVNSARGTSRTCGDTEFPAVGPVVWSERIEAAAFKHSSDMAGRNVLSHTGAAGSDVGTRLSSEGYRWRLAAENIASGYSSPEGVVQGWLASEGHCVTIMNSGYTEMGGSSVDSSGEKPVRYWTQVFARPNL